MKLEELEIEAFGRVQGVGFRMTVKSYASKHNIKGFIANKEIGSVIIEVQGEKKELDNFLSWLHSNPGFSRIDTLKYTWRKIVIKYDDFKIIRNGNIFSEQARNLFNLGKYVLSKKIIEVPKHVAIIPDGNRRWARGKGIFDEFGHYKAINFENMYRLLIEADKIGIKYLDFWGFSTENWKRGNGEKDALFKLIGEAVEKFGRDFNEHNFKFKHIGRKDRLPAKLLKILKDTEEMTKKNTGLNVQFCLDYGGRDEILRAINKLLKSGKKKVDEREFSGYLDTAGMPDVDLVIRTSGEQRTSGFMPFQATYAELCFVSDKHFPDFNSEDLRKAVEWYGKRDRRFGGNSK